MQEEGLAEEPGGKQRKDIPYGEEKPQLGEGRDDEAHAYVTLTDEIHSYSSIYNHKYIPSMAQPPMFQEMKTPEQHIRSLGSAPGFWSPSAM